jgi:hypothetical protein
MKAPRFRTSGTAGDIRVKHVEYVGTIAALSGDFECLTHQLNPGLSRTFPWLSGIAKAYETYTMNECCFAFKTSCATSNTGNVMLAFDPDPDDDTPPTMSDLLQMKGAVANSVWKHVAVPVDKRDMQFIPKRYVRSGGISSIGMPGGQSMKNFDFGKFHVATQGTGGALACGHLYVAYDVTLMTPTPPEIPIGTYAPAGTFTNLTLCGSLDMPYVTGHVPVTYSSPTLMIMSTPFTGLVLAYVVGTTVTTAPTQGTGTNVDFMSEPEDYEAANTATLGYGTFFVSAKAGQYLGFEIGAATVTDVTYRFIECSLASMPPLGDL